MPAHRLHRLQHHLERIYELDISYDVDRFVLTDPAVARRLDAGPAARNIPEKLLISEQDDALHVTLYLDPAVIDVLDANDPIDSLNDGNLAEFWTAVEGVSHFVYLVWNAHHGRSISLFELELQAEVDKFVAAVFLSGLQRDGRVPQDIYHRLFAAPVFAADLDGGEARRYYRANHFAKLYCNRLRQQYLATRGPGMVRELRRFYRLTHRHKLRHICIHPAA